MSEDYNSKDWYNIWKNHFGEPSKNTSNNENESPDMNTKESILSNDLLDSDDEMPEYENDSSYEHNTESDSVISGKRKIDRQTPINSNNTNSTEKSFGQTESSNLIKEKTDCELKIYKKNKLAFLIISIIMIIIWVGFLLEPMTLAFLDKQVVNIFYFGIFLTYTIFSCILPFRILNRIQRFSNTGKKERKALKTGENFDTNEHRIWEAYKSTFFDKSYGLANKTRASADLYFNYESVANAMFPSFPVVNTFKLIAGSFTGFGILGTFLGFSIGFGSITDFSSTSTLSKQIEGFIESGLGTAFNTSIVGIICSLLYSFCIYNPLLQKINKYFEKLSDSLDQEFYVSETEAIMQYTMLTTENNENITFSKSLRLIVDNMKNQTDALNNFNNDLADKIANMKDTISSRLENFSTEVGTGLKDAVIDNVNSEMESLKLSLTDASKQLGLVADKISNTPELLGKANEELKTYLEDTRSSFSEMLNQNLEANRTALNEIVDTIQTELTSRFSEFKTSLTEALSNSQKAAELLSNVPDKLKYLESVESNLTGILNDLTSAEDNIKELLASAKINEDNSGRNLTAVISETNRMLEGFKAVDINLKNIFESIGNGIDKYNSTVNSTLKQYLSSFEEGSKSFTSSISGSIQEFGDALQDLSTNITEIQETSKSFEESINQLGEILGQRENPNQQDDRQ